MNNMKHKLPVAAVLSLILVTGIVCSNEKNEEYHPHALATDDHFLWNYAVQNINLNNRQNIIVSPFLVKLLLVTLLEATLQNTNIQRELSRVLDVAKLGNGPGVRYPYHGLLTQLKNDKNNTWNVATRLFMAKTLRPHPKFIEISSKFYATDVECVDFDDTNTTVDRINDWVSNQTNHSVNNLVDGDNVAGGKSLLMVSAVYFNGVWSMPFEKEEEGIFNSYHSTASSVIYMKQSAKLFYGQFDEFTVVKLPYRGDHYVLVVVMENDRNDTVEELTIEDLHYLQRHTTEQYIDLMMPRFDIKFKSNIIKPLKRMGLRKLFAENVLLPGINMDNSDSFKITGGIQQSGIRISLNGTEAFSAVSLELSDRMGSPTSTHPQVTINKPFGFFLQDKITDTILFAGKIFNLQLS